MLQRLYQRVIALAASPRAGWWLALVAFAEASVFPVPPDALLIPMAIASPRRAWRLAAIATAGSVTGGALGYLIGYALLDRLARPLIQFYGYGHAFAAFQALYQRWGLWVILIKGFTPIPYKIVTIASGAAAFSFPLFMAASLATRGGRFFLIAFLLNRWGEQVRAVIERRLGLVVLLLVLGIVGGFVALRFL
jgi:membrane protein YqaA with SNARE-associated domain